MPQRHSRWVADARSAADARSDAEGRTTAIHTGRRLLVRDLLARPEGLWITCVGHSMEPTIRKGDRVRVVALGESERVRLGEVILFEAHRGGYVLHRAIARVPAMLMVAHRRYATMRHGYPGAREPRSYGGTCLVHVGDRPGSRLGVIAESRILGRVPAMGRAAALKHLWPWMRG